MAGGTGSILRNTVEHNSNVAAALPQETRMPSSYLNSADPHLMLSLHSEALLRGLNALRCADKLFDVTLIVEDKTFKVFHAKYLEYSVIYSIPLSLLVFCRLTEWFWPLAATISVQCSRMQCEKLANRRSN